MRKLVYAINLTADGCCDHTKGIVNPELHQFWTEFVKSGDAFVYGRITYELMVPFWPDVAKKNSGEDAAMNDFAKAFASIKDIFVFSRTLKSVGDQRNATIINGDLKTEILKLKNQPGGNLLAGGVDLPSQLTDLDLVDEFIFVVQPCLVGDGRRLLQGYDMLKKLQLVEAKVLKGGSVALHYKKGD